MYDSVYPAIDTARATKSPGALISRLLSRLSPDQAEIQSLERDQATVISELLAYIAESDRQLAEQQQRIARLETLSMTDELTGVANRRGFESGLKQALATAERHEETGVLGFFDLDDFKSVNDRFGHDEGDRLLIRAARLLAGHVRDGDYVARLGGDEFAVVLARCSARAGRAKLRSIQRALSDIMSPGADEGLSTSLGVRPFGPGDSLKDILLAADREMYRQKRSRQHQGLAPALTG